MVSKSRPKPIDAVVIHHTVVPEQDWSQERTSAALRSSDLAYDGKAPYHRGIGNSWHYQARPDETVGYHSGNYDMNLRSVGIALTGNFNQDQPTPHQKHQLGHQIKDLMAEYHIPRNRVFLHKQVRDKPTACPGSFITKTFLDTLLHNMSCEPQKKRVTELTTQVKRLQVETRKLTGEVHEANGVIKDFENVFMETKSLLSL